MSAVNAIVLREHKTARKTGKPRRIPIGRKLAELLAPVTVTLTRKAGESDQLFGSVTAADIAEALAAQGFHVDKRRIQLDEPIKLVGEYQVTARLPHEVAATFKVIVQREG